jgi:MscS family membrane protein
MSETLDLQILKIPLYRYLISIGIFFLSLILRRVFNRYILKLLKKWTTQTSFKYDDLFIEAIHPPVSALIMVSGLFSAIFALNITPAPNAPPDAFQVGNFLHQVYPITLSIITVWAAYRLSGLLAYIVREIFANNNEELSGQFSDLFKQALRIMVIVIGGIWILQNLGYSVGSLLAGLGIGGLAVALAAQDTLANFFGTIVMVTDRPFKVGDWVQFQNVDGLVEFIGFRSTRVRTWSKSLMIIPNKVLTSEIIQNWSAMSRRRVRMTIGMTYDSPRDKIQFFLEKIRELLRNDPDVDPEVIQVFFTDFGASSLDILVNYFTKAVQMAEHLQVREKINLNIMQLAEEAGLSFAFPSQTVYFGNEFYAAKMRQVESPQT